MSSIDDIICFRENLQNYRFKLCNLNTYAADLAQRPIEYFQYELFQDLMMVSAKKLKFSFNVQLL